jgi:aldose 1-epimerase
MKRLIKLTFAMALLLAAGLQAAEVKGVTQKSFGKLADGSEAMLYTLTNKSGARLKITNYGGIVTSIEAPDRKGQLADVVLGYDSLDGYVKNSPYFGAIIGRYGNRIGKGTFKLNGKTYTLAKNNGANALHGGLKGFDKVLWKAEPRETPEGPAILLSYTSVDGEEGYPGTLTVQALHTWTDKNELKIDFTATTDKSTVVNLTHHSYFNLSGAGDILGHYLTIQADKFTPVDAGLIPTGKLQAVKGTPFDFNKLTAIGARIEAKNEQLKRGKGYDHNWVLRKKAGALELAARVLEPVSGRVLEVETTEPGLQFYSGNFLDGTITGKGGKVYALRNGFCLEPQHFPDSPNKPKFPSTRLDPGQTYHHSLVYRFLAQ